MSDQATAGSICLSIVIPTYNYGHRIQRALSSVLSQREPDVEIIVVDDGSTDDTLEVLRKMSTESDGGFRWIAQSNRGAAAARNKGLAESFGRYLMFLDADDELLPGALEALMPTLRRSEDAHLVVLGGHISRRPDGVERTHLPPSAVSENGCARLRSYLLDRRIRVSHGAFAAARGLFEARPYSEILRGREDIPVFSYLVARGSIRVVPHPLVLIHKHVDSLRNLTRSAVDADPKVLVDEVFEWLPEECQPLRKRYLCRRYLSELDNAAKAGSRRAGWRFLREATLAWPPGVLRWKTLRSVARLLA